MKLFKHLNTILKHKWYVFKFCCMVGEPWRGLVHDMSKFSPTEFWESVKYYNGTHSPILDARRAKGYSECTLHHQGRNKHHFHYWIDFDCPEISIVLPYKYAVEMVCDNLSAGIVYNGKNWTQSTQYNYWIEHKGHLIINPKMDNFLTETLLQVKDYGIKATLTKKNMKQLYKKNCIDDKTKYRYELKGEWKIEK